MQEITMNRPHSHEQSQLTRMRLVAANTEPKRYYQDNQSQTWCQWAVELTMAGWLAQHRDHV